MPIYEFRCPQGHIFELFRPVAEYAAPARCPCGEAGERVILTPPRVFGDLEGYESPASGEWIEGRRARAEDFARTGTRPYDPGEKEEAVRQAATAERQLDRSIEGAVESTLHELCR
jgi:putative FmdB family regulatory protein